MKKKPKWDEGRIREAASKYTTRSGFAFGNKPAYEAARLTGMLDNLYDLVLNQWDTDAVKSEALKYKSRTEFARKSGSAYNAARRLGIIGDLFNSRLRSWTLDEIKTLAAACDNKKDLKRKNATAYNAALRLGVIDDLFTNQVRVKARDCIYMWSVDDEPGLYKVGITSNSMGDYRINQVAKEAGFSPTVIMLEHVGYEGAKVLERKMKRLGTRYTFNRRFYGHTEFRYMSPEQVSQCVQMVKEYRVSRGM